MKFRTRLLVFLLVNLAALVSASAAKAEVMRWTIDGVQREAIVFPPSKNTGSGKAPLLFAFHWHGGNMQEAAEGMRFQSLWPEAIVVYMQGLPTKIYVDPLGLENGWQSEPGRDGDRDLKFFDAVLTTLRAKFPVDDRRIYSTGFSNGGIFTYVLWGARAKIFAAFAPVAAQIFPGVRLTEPKPLLHIVGKEDTVVPFKEQLQSIKTARDLNGSNEKGTPCGENCMTYSSSKGAPVVTYIHAGGHVYPPNASAMIVNFFKGYAIAK
jgi:polyhydroxybutyrate depolymerase